MSHTSRDAFIEKSKDTKNTNDDEKYKEDTLRHQDNNESVYNPKTSYSFRGDSIIKTTKEEKSFIKRSMTINFKHYVIQSVIYIVILCRKK